VAVTFKNIEKVKKEKTSTQATNNGKQKERVLRPWEAYEKEPDLMELITKRKSDKKVVKKTFKKNVYKKTEKEDTPKIEMVDDLQTKLEKAKLKYFGDLI